MTKESVGIETLLKAVQSDEAMAQRFALEPGKVLAEHGATLQQFHAYFMQLSGQQPPLGPGAAIRPAAIAAAAEPPPPLVSVSIKPWGISLHFSHSCLTAIESGSLGVAALGGAVQAAITSGAGWITAAIAAGSGPIGAIVAGVVFAKIAEFVAVDALSNFSGCWVPVTWLQLPTLALPGLALVYIHPLPASWG